jgi:hypothetical protein
MKASIVILIGAVVIAVLVLSARESTRTGSVTSAERLPPPTGTEQRRSSGSAAERPAPISTPRRRTSELPAQEESAIAIATPEFSPK